MPVPAIATKSSQVKKRLKAANTKLKGALGTGTAAIIETQDALSLRPSDVLAGTAGGAMGALAGVKLSVLIGVTAGACSPLLALLLGASAALLWRGPRSWRFDRAARINKTSNQEILQRIDALPDNAPDFVSDQLWDSYYKIQLAYGDIAEEGLGYFNRDILDIPKARKPFPRSLTLSREAEDFLRTLIAAGRTSFEGDFRVPLVELVDKGLLFTRHDNFTPGMYETFVIPDELRDALVRRFKPK